MTRSTHGIEQQLERRRAAAVRRCRVRRDARREVPAGAVAADRDPRRDRRRARPRARRQSGTPRRASSIGAGKLMLGREPVVDDEDAHPRPGGRGIGIDCRAYRGRRRRTRRRGSTPARAQVDARIQRDVQARARAGRPHPRWSCRPRRATSTFGPSNVAASCATRARASATVESARPSRPRARAASVRAAPRRRGCWPSRTTGRPTIIRSARSGRAANPRTSPDCARVPAVIRRFYGRGGIPPPPAGSVQLRARYFRPGEQARHRSRARLT